MNFHGSDDGGRDGDFGQIDCHSHKGCQGAQDGYLFFFCFHGQPDHEAAVLPHVVFAFLLFRFFLFFLCHNAFRAFLLHRISNAFECILPHFAGNGELGDEMSGFGDEMRDRNFASIAGGTVL